MWGHPSPCGCALCKSLVRCHNLIRAGVHLPNYIGLVTDRVRLLEGALRDDLSLFGIGEATGGNPFAPGVVPPQAPPPRPFAPQEPEAPATAKVASPIVSQPTQEILQTTPKYPPPEKTGVGKSEEGFVEVKREKDANVEEKKEAVADPPPEEEKKSPRKKEPRKKRSKSRGRRDRKRRKRSKSPRTKSPARASSSKRKRKEENPDPPQERERTEVAEGRKAHQPREEEEKGEKSPSREEKETEKVEEKKKEPVPEPAGEPPSRHSSWENQESTDSRGQGGGWRGVIPYSNHPRWTKGVNKGLTKRAKQEYFGRRKDKYYDGRR